jgi:hypothetical protein
MPKRKEKDRHIDTLQINSPPYRKSGYADHPFIVLPETKLSIRYIPVWARYSPPNMKGQRERGGKVKEEHYEEASRSDSMLTSESGNLAATAVMASLASL